MRETKKLTIDIEGTDTDQLVYALEEAKRWIEQGYVEGTNSNEDSSYFFRVQVAQ